MKGDILFYRFPHGDVQQTFGVFEKVNQFSPNSGFILSDFNWEEKFIFIETKSEPKLYFRNDEVNCLSKEEYIVSASLFLNQLRNKQLSKAIFSRVKKVQGSFEIEKLFKQLCDTYPDAFVYLVSSPLFGTWIGATPEVLLESSGGKAKTIALAGTIAVNSQEEWSEKEIEEQQYVVDFVTRKLNDSSIQELEISQKMELIAGPVKHLVTNFNFQLPQNDVLALIQELHPTPAVSGLPREDSLELIEEIESHERRFYAGVIGFISEYETKLFVNLRCAEIQENSSFLYVGGGFTKDSDVEKEWNETERKAETLLNVMQKN